MVICGGGVAAVETLLALRSHIEVGLDIHLVAPNTRFVYQPLAVAEPFDLAETHLLDLAEIAAEQGARLHVDSIAAVEGDARRIRLASEAQVPFDALVLAVGARRRAWLEGALHFGGAESVSAFRRLLGDLAEGAGQQVAFVVPTGVGWTLALYELALLTASRLAEQGVIGVELAVVTPEREPLALFGPTAGRMLRDLLADRGIRLMTKTSAESFGEGSLRLDSGATLTAEHVVTLPELGGPALPGLPCNESGFIPIDRQSRVSGLEDVYAAGDGTDSPIKQGGIAAQQADAAAGRIAARMGAPVRPSTQPPTLRAELLTGVAPTYLRARITDTGSDSFEVGSSPLWWPPSKIAAPHLAGYLDGHNSLARDRTLEDLPPSGSGTATLAARRDEARELALLFAERDAADHHYRSALDWLEVIERLDGVLPPGYLHKRSEWQRRARG